ncbi:hypothetical protein ABZ876_27690 [Streptomyces sp. NPDC046931]|uniref:hypothetical protein n=1 Tax=Streptomyces sp. NPDC046931 TaxID=3154806 RepID=UPI0033F7E02D
MYFAFREDDIVLIVDFADPVSMAAVSLAVKAEGALRTLAPPLPHPRRDRQGRTSTGRLSRPWYVGTRAHCS